VGRWGTYVVTPDVADDKSSVLVKTEIRNQSDHEAKMELRTSVLDPAGKTVTRDNSAADIPAGGVQTVAANLTVMRPQRWDTEHPYLYTVVSEVMDGKRVVDRYTTPFGIRTIVFDKDKGFLLNGRYMKIQGVCNHADLGALGAAVNWRATERQLEIMKGAGVNAIRTSHNPPSPELLELCDRMGLMVMDESFDMWRIPMVPNGYAKYFDEWSERDLRDMVRRDRNHPSIIMYSIGNEIPEQGRADGWQEAKRLTGLFHQEDPTRPTTSAFNNWAAAIKNKLADEVDIPGFNYQPMRYEQIMKEHPNWVIYGSETASCVSSRGVYQLPIQKYEKDPSLQVSSYDIIAPPWAYCPDVDFTYQDRFPQVLGEFVWTGFDYIGEPTPFFGGQHNEADWPARSSYFGMVDLAGFPKDRYYLYRSYWRPNETTIHILPHWNWPDRVGKNVPVFVYTNGDSAELFLNGKSLGRRTKGVVLPKPQNLARGKAVTASSGANAGLAVDGDAASEWRAQSAGGNPWLQVDLGAVQPVKQIALTLGSTATGAGYKVQVSSDGAAWTGVATVAARTPGGRGGAGGRASSGRGPTSASRSGRRRRGAWPAGI